MLRRHTNKPLSVPPSKLYLEGAPQFINILLQPGGEFSKLKLNPAHLPYEVVQGVNTALQRVANIGGGSERSSCSDSCLISHK